MAVYSLHAPRDERDLDALAERLTTVRQGFSRAGLVFGPLWLLARRLWRPLAGFVAGAAAVGFLVANGHISGGTALLLYLLSAIYIGLEGRAMQEAALARRGLPLRFVIAAEDPAVAEARFFERALRAPSNPAATPRTALRPHAPDAIIGLFPEAGG